MIGLVQRSWIILWGNQIRTDLFEFKIIKNEEISLAVTSARYRQFVKMK